MRKKNIRGLQPNGGGNMITLEELYGCTLKEYAAYHDTTIEQLINKTQKDIDLLMENYQTNYASRNIHLTPHELDIAQAIQLKIAQKRKHLERLKGWKG